jgi:hypothetical protein
MIFLFWSGWGWLVPIIGFMQLALMELTVNALERAPDYYEKHGGPKCLGLLLGGVCLWLLARCLKNKDATRLVVGKATGR